MENNTQVRISDGDKKVLGRVRPFEEHRDTVLKQVEETSTGSERATHIQDAQERGLGHPGRRDGKTDLDQVQGLVRSVYLHG